MSHATLILDKRSAKKDGTYPIKIRVSHRGEFYLSTGRSVTLEQWCTSDSKGILTGAVVNHPLAARYNALINSRKLEVDKRLLALTDSRDILKMDNAQLREYLLQDDTPGQRTYSFVKHYELYCSERTSKNTLVTFRNTYINIGKFCDVATLSFEQITYEWLKDFDKFLTDSGISINGRGVYMRNIRAIFNDAIKCGRVDLGAYPFRNFKIKTEKTRKRALTVEQLRELRDHKCEAYQERYRDMFMLIFYLHGINLVDLLQLREITNGRIEFSRSKTGHLHSIKVEPEAIEIINRYRGKEYLLNILEGYKDYRDFTHRMNIGLKKIGELTWVENAAKTKKNTKAIKAFFPDISSYWARHTVATLAKSIGVSIDTIAAMLGHEQNTVTHIYIDYDLDLIDKANRKLIDYVNGNEKKRPE